LPVLQQPAAKNMRKLYFILLLCAAIPVATTAQTEAELKSSLDSMLKNDALAQMLDSLGTTDAKSSFDINIGFGNRLFSLSNNSLTADQADVRKLIVTPSVGYFHKSGFGLTLTAFLGADSGTTTIFQTGIMPSYDYVGKKLSAGISYTRYIENSSLSVSASPFQNDIYAYITAEKGLLQPGLAIGYASGKYKEYVDSIRIRPAPLPPIRIRDTTTYKLKDFSMLGSVKHDFEFFNVLGKKDGLLITPQLILIAGSQKYTVNSNATAITRRSGGGVLRLRNTSSSTENTAFTLQSAAFSLDVDYSIGKFYVRPQVYLDYYLPQTDGTRLTSTFSCVLGVSF
jgi:hypothetical protein